MIGPEFLRFVPFLTALFAFILVNNLFGIIPLIQFPTFSHPGVPYALAVIVWLIYNYGRHPNHGLRAATCGYRRGRRTCRGGCGSSSPRSSSSRTSSCGRSRCRCDCSATCSPGTCCWLVFIFGGDYMLFVADSLDAEPALAVRLRLGHRLHVLRGLRPGGAGLHLRHFHGVVHRLSPRRRPLTADRAPGPRPLGASRGHPERKEPT